MTSANLDLVRPIRAAWEHGDYTSTEWADPGIEYVLVDGPSPGSWTGHAGMAEGFRDLASACEQLHSRAEEYRELERGRVLVLISCGGRGKTSGVELGQIRARGAALFHIQDGKVTRFEHWFDRDRALADLGLATEAESQ